MGARIPDDEQDASFKARVERTVGQWLCDMPERQQLLDDLAQDSEVAAAG